MMKHDSAPKMALKFYKKYRVYMSAECIRMHPSNEHTY